MTNNVVSLFPTKPPRQKIVKQEDTPDTDYCVYRGDFIHGEDRVQVTVDTIDDNTQLLVYDIHTGEPYAEYNFDNYTLYLLSGATERMFSKLKADDIRIF